MTSRADLVPTQITERLVLTQDLALPADRDLKLGDTVDLIVTARVMSVATRQDIPAEVEIDYVLEPIRVRTKTTGDSDIDDTRRQIDDTLDSLQSLFRRPRPATESAA